MKGAGKNGIRGCSAAAGSILWVQGRMSLVKHKYLLCLWQDLSQGTTAAWKEKWAGFDDPAVIITLTVRVPVAALLEGITRGRAFFPPSKQNGFTLILEHSAFQRHYRSFLAKIP